MVSLGHSELMWHDQQAIFFSFFFSGWLFKIELSKKDELDELMDEDAYKAFLESQ